MLIATDYVYTQRFMGDRLKLPFPKMEIPASWAWCLLADPAAPCNQEDPAGRA